MAFLKRLFGGSPRPASTGVEPDVTSPFDEAARERELLLEEARRLDDDLIQRQLRYADRAWTPPPQGGTRRADDDEPDDEARGDH
jgi:hypothetical protein